MKAKVQILSVSNRIDAKSKIVYWKACCLDMDTGSSRMMNTFDYSFSQADVEANPDPMKLENQVVELALTDLRAGFGGRFEYRGHILAPSKVTK